MYVLIAGGSGFIGQQLAATLMKSGHRVTVIDLYPPKSVPAAFRKIDLVTEKISPEVFIGVDAVIHLAGRNIFVRWDKKIKREIHESRVTSTQNLVAALEHIDKKPSVLLSASGIGFYGDGGEDMLDESSPVGNDFLARVCVDWEHAARKAEAFGIRTVQVRTAPVIGQIGFLQSMLPFFRLGFGGTLGSGTQWFPWIHIEDIVGIYSFLLENSAISGPVNACAPGLTRNQEFTRMLAEALYRPSFLSIPKWFFGIRFGELADIMLISEKAIPKVLLEHGYQFRFPKLKDALEDVLYKG